MGPISLGEEESGVEKKEGGRKEGRNGPILPLGARARFSRDEDEERPEIEVLEFEFLSLLSKVETDGGRVSE